MFARIGARGNGWQDRTVTSETDGTDTTDGADGSGTDGTSTDDTDGTSTGGTGRNDGTDGMSTDGAEATVCPCGAAQPYDRCCGRLHRGEAQASTAEQLMRSRYTAFARQDAAYLMDTWHPSSRPRRVRFDAAGRWVGLEVVATDGGGMLDTEGTVEFIAHHIRGGERRDLHEISLFVRDEGRWRYLGPVDASLD
jgi:SEC-C motif-containing protein